MPRALVWAAGVCAALSTGCGPGSVVAPREDGADCERDADCVSGNCLSGPRTCGRPCVDEDDCAPGLACAPALDGAEDGTPPAAGLACVPGGDGAAAGAACTDDTGCASLLCVESLCVEACGDCPAGEACEPEAVVRLGEEVAVGLCRWRFPPPALELGPVTTGIEGSAEIPFDVPAGTISIVVALIDDDGLRVSARTLVAPDGTLLLDVTDGSPDLNPADAYPGAAAVMVPITDDPAAAPRAGTYRLTAGTYDPANFAALDPVPGALERVAVIFERAGEEGGLLDLMLHFAPATGLEAASAADSAFVAELLAATEALLAGPGRVRLAGVSFGADLPAEADVVESGDEARALSLARSLPGPRGASLNVFLVQDLTFSAGLSGGIPGPPGLTGTTASGIVAEMLGSGTDTGILLAHEIGHFLGLSHTTEASGAGDPISDTPVCPPGVLVADCPDYTNLMFPIFPLSTALVLSPAQVDVLGRAPLLWEIVRPAACPEAGGAVDVTGEGWATGDTAALGAALAGACGGGGAPERAHLHRVTSAGLASLEVRVLGADFAPAVYVRTPGCADPAPELACVTAEAGVEAVASIPAPAPGPYFVVVDGRDGAGGTYTLEVIETAN